MGLIYADIQLINGDDQALARRGYLREGEIKKIDTPALVDSGAYMLAINEQTKIQLDLAVLEEQIVELADGSLQKVEIVGPVEIRFENRQTTARAVVLPSSTDILLGSIPMEDMDVLIDPKRQRLVVNPAHPYIAQKPMKGFLRDKL
uniref:Clan AA aspartic protease, AF_0612 family n=1 Tax=Candidatus Kentrum sp. FM TaxID=2126340 RepID=A0A450SJG2_9GAMM|nr:MAG: clan AA aspartic protease, AF_0612 family [Candidatus Kentron sp. FM]VFJ53832.1 MAG: clan AA aspartic protease, AF_0612 family [Candidatus Kentron sp. FM]VFK07308.1 MAG: clan AA aspartic protease, AF_0612 family [Candidatus Kentron sp. FM]